MIQSNHYRKLFNFSFEGLRASKAATERIRNFKRRMEEAVPLSIASWEGPLSPRDRIDRARNEFWTALRDDLNTPEALAALYTMVSDLNALDDRVPFSSQERQEVLLFLNEANQIFEAWPNTSGESDQEIEVLVQERIQAKKNKDWKRADEIRDQIQSLGITLEDTRDGQSKWFRR
jgi:cysteinyl-tRNA synthetase